MSCFDELIESIEYPTILIIYDDQYQIAKKYENDILIAISYKKAVTKRECGKRAYRETAVGASRDARPRFCNFRAGRKKSYAE